MSPECLDSITRYLHPINGVMIPSSYTSYLAPLTASKVYMAARDYRSSGDSSDGEGRTTTTRGLETPFVVKLHAAAYLAPSAPLFTFLHPPLPSSSSSSSAILSDHRRFLQIFSYIPFLPVCNIQYIYCRYASVSFAIAQHCTVHGFSGTFQTTLFGDVELATVPEIHTPNMYSWFPLFIPLLQPLSLQPRDTLTVAVFR